jgi:hypothetical protein
MYRNKGRCREMGTFDAGTLSGEPVTFKTTVHGPVIGYATVKGKRVAISSKRSSYGEDTLDQLFSRRLSNGQVDDPGSFFKAAALTPQTFNSFYIDDEHVAAYTSGRLPIRDERVDPGLPTIGTGKYEWTGFLNDYAHPHGVDPKDGTMTNWNQSAARGFGAADDDWGKNGSVDRVDLLNRNLARLRRGGEWTLASVTAAMNAAATQDVRAIDTVPLLKRLPRGSQAPTPQAQQMLDAMIAWKQRGGSRLDRDLDGFIDDPGAAIMDAAWSRIADAFMAPRIGPQLDEARHAVLALRRAAGRPVRRLVSVLRPRHPQPARDGSQAAVRERLLRARQVGSLPAGDLGGDRRCGRRADGRAGDRRPPGLARRRDGGADRVRPRPPADHAALHQPPERDPAGDLVRWPPLNAAPARPMASASSPRGSNEPLLGSASRALSSVGRAPPRQGGGRWFEPSSAHLDGICVDPRQSPPIALPERDSGNRVGRSEAWRSTPGTCRRGSRSVASNPVAPV